MPETRIATPELTRTLLGILAILLLIAGTAWVLTPFVPALLWASTIVVATWPLLLRVEALVGGRRPVAVAIMTLGLLLALFLPLTYLIAAVLDNSDRLVELAQALKVRPLPEPPHWLETIPLLGQRVAGTWREWVAGGPEALLARIEPYSGRGVAYVAARAGGIGRVIVEFLLTVGLTAVLFTSGEASAAWVRAVAQRLAGARGDSAVILAAQAIRGVALGVVVTALAQAVLGGIGLAVTGVPGAPLLTAAMFFLAIIHVGAVLPMLAAVAWLFWTGHKAAGGVLLVWALVVGTLDNVLRPWLIRRGANLPLLLILAGVIGGLIAFGLVGLFIGPVVLAVTYTLLQAWVREGAPDTPATETPLPAPPGVATPSSTRPALL
jgi:predicted PurR-regulated permease PerM